MKEMSQISNAKHQIAENKIKTQELEEKVKGTDAKVNRTEKT